MAETDAVLDGVVEVLFGLVLELQRSQAGGELELTLPQVLALKMLQRETLTTNSLAAKLDISAPAASQLADRLASKKLIGRETSDKDRRSVVIALTDRGRRVVEGLRKKRIEIFEELLSRLTVDDRRFVVEALGRLVSVIEPVAAPGGLPAVTPADARTAPEPPTASNQGRARVGTTNRRMRIEWD